MIEVFDTAAARLALERRRLPCPGCGAPLRPWGRARIRTVTGRAGAAVTARPDRARCTGCSATHVVLDAGMLPRHGYAVGVVGAALLAAAAGLGHRRVAAELDVPEGTVRSWLRRARAQARSLYELGVRATVALDQELLPKAVQTSPLAQALDALGAAALAMARRFGLDHVDPWTRINVLTIGGLITTASPG